jgi:phage terminase large subunit-like protein
MRERFLKGRFADLTEGAYWNGEDIEKWRTTGSELPDMQRIVIGVDPSGAGDEENSGNEEIGIVVCGLGTDGNAYVLEDLSIKAGPRKWGNVVASAYDRHLADKVIGEINYGGAMVEHVVQTARPRTPFEAVTASRGKAVRAEPISALAEQGKIRHAGTFMQLEEELCSFTKGGYVGSGSPNRADAFVWAMTALFPALTRKERKDEKAQQIEIVRYTQEESSQNWLGT